MPRRAKTSVMLRLKGGKLEPLGPWDAEILAAAKDGDEFLASLSSTKTMPKLFNKYWAVLDRLVQNTHLSEKWPTSRDLSDALMVRAKHVDYYETIGGTVVVRPYSPAELSEEDFQRFYDDAIDYVCAVLVPGLDRDALTEARTIVCNGDDAL
jgi:hypothetical protein